MQESACKKEPATDSEPLFISPRFLPHSLQFSQTTVGPRFLQPLRYYCFQEFVFRLTLFLHIQTDVFLCFFLCRNIRHRNVSRVAVLSQRPRGWERQLNLISWNDGEPKYDIRDWSPDGTRMGKGISLSHDELAILKGILEDMEL